MPGPPQPIPVRVHRAAGRLVLVAPMTGLEPRDITVEVMGDRIVIHGAERGPHQHERDLVVAEWRIGPYRRELTLPAPVDGRLVNATYGNGVLVLAMPCAADGGSRERIEIRLDATRPTRGRRVGHVGRSPRPPEARAGDVAPAAPAEGIRPGRTP